MHRLFNEKRSSGAGYHPPEMQRIRTGLQDCVNQIRTYRRENPRGVMGSHPISDLVYNLNISHHYDLPVYLSRVEAVTIQKSIALKMTSAFNRGKIFREGVFFTKYRSVARVKEILIVTTDEFDVKDFEQHWKDYAPIRAVSHPFTDLSLQVPDGYQSFAGEGIAVVTVNVPMLAGQYYLWRKERKIADTLYGPRTVEQFIQEIPIPNMLMSLLDVTMMNRTINMYFDLPINPMRQLHSFRVVDFDQALRNMQKTAIEYLLPRRYNFDQLLSSIPLVYSKRYHDIIRTPEQGFTRQIQWAILVSRLPLLAFLLIQNRTFQNEQNRHYLNHLKLYLRLSESERILQSALPKEDYEEARAILDNGVYPYL